MATVIDSFLLSLGLESRGIDQGMAEARQRLSRGFAQISQAVSSPLKAVSAAFSAFPAFIQGSTELLRLSESLGLSAEALQGWRYAAESAGAGAEEVEKFFRTMNSGIVEGAVWDSGPLREMVQQLGVSLKDARGNIRLCG